MKGELPNTGADFALILENLPRGACPIIHFGLGRHRFHIPGVDCPTCGMKWGSGRILNMDCPEELRADVTTAWNDMSYRQLGKNVGLRRRCEAAILAQGVDVELMPGDTFPSFVWKTSCHPTRRMYWPVDAIIVAESLAARIQDAEVTGFGLFELELERVGDYESPDDIPDECWRWCNDVEDIVDVVFPVDDPRIFGEFRCVVPAHHTYYDWQHGLKPYAKVCDTCGDIDVPKEVVIEENKKKSAWRRKRVLPRQFCPPADIFRSHIYHEGVIVSQRMLKLLDARDLEWFKVQPISIVD